MASIPPVPSGSPHIYTHPEVPEAFVVDTDRNGIDGDDMVCLGPDAGTLYSYEIEGQYFPRFESVVDQETLDSIGRQLLRAGWQRETEKRTLNGNLCFEVSGVVPETGNLGLYACWLGATFTGLYGIIGIFVGIVAMTDADYRRRDPSWIKTVKGGFGIGLSLLAVAGALVLYGRSIVKQQREVRAFTTVR
ncbi:MAG: hypothetical protein HY539_03225 [Deltaproteobacteria bacterium]|nr:hypothetical protein [Deltaproteobacteria bacterium]